MRALEGKVVELRNATFASRENVIDVEHRRLPDLNKVAVTILSCVALEDLFANGNRDGGQTHDTLCG